MLEFNNFHCLKCDSMFPEQDDPIYSIVKDKICFHLFTGLFGGEISCAKCDEKHDIFLYEGELTLTLTSIHKEYTGTKERKFRNAVKK